MIHYLLKVYDDTTDEVIFLKEYPRLSGENHEELMEEDYQIREKAIYKYMEQLTIDDAIDLEIKSIKENPDLFEDEDNDIPDGEKVDDEDPASYRQVGGD